MVDVGIIGNWYGWSKLYKIIRSTSDFEITFISI